MSLFNQSHNKTSFNLDLFLYFLCNDDVPAGYTDYSFLLHGGYYIRLETLRGEWRLKDMGFLPAALFQNPKVIIDENRIHPGLIFGRGFLEIALSRRGVGPYGPEAEA